MWLIGIVVFLAFVYFAESLKKLIEAKTELNNSAARLNASELVRRAAVESEIEEVKKRMLSAAVPKNGPIGVVEDRLE